MTETWWLTMRVHPWSALLQDGRPAPIQQTARTPTAWCGAFRDRAAALAWVDGDEGRVVPMQVDPTLHTGEPLARWSAETEG